MSVRNLYLKSIFLLSLGLVFANCGAAAFSSSSGASEAVVEDVVGGNVSALELDSESASLSLEDLGGSDNAVIVLYGYDTAGATMSFEVAGEGSVASQLTAAQHYLAQDESGDVTEAFHDTLRGLEQDIDADASPAQIGRYLMRQVSVGSERSFKVLTSGNSYQTVQATLRYSTARFNFYVDKRNASSLTDSDLATLAANFNVDAMHDLFGDESDVDADGKFAVLFSQAVNELGASEGGLITGFFYAVDLFDDAMYSMSNEMEVFYTVVPDPTGAFGTAITKAFALSNIFPTVLPHELQHMISFNQHYFLNGGAAETAWLNEGLSHLAEDVANADGDLYMTGTSLENPSRVAVYLDAVQNTCSFCGSSLAQRGGSYLLLRYLYEQAQQGAFSNLSNGFDFIERVVNTELTGTTNLIDTLFGGSGTQADLKPVLGRFALAAYLSDTGASDDDRLSFTGINLRSTQNDNRGTVLDGPAVQTISSFPYADTLQGNAIAYIQISADQIAENGGSLQINLGSGAQIGGYLIK